MALNDIVEVSDLFLKPRESESGCIEYKYKLVNLSTAQKERLSSQMKFRLLSDDEYGQAIYDIGLTDDGFALGLNEVEMSESLSNLSDIAALAGAKICDVRRESTVYYAESEDDLVRKFMDSKGSEHKRRVIATEWKEGLNRYERFVSEVLIRKHDSDSDYIELRIGIAGNVDAGKSSLTGVLTKGVLDNGNGSARTSVANYKHELEYGRTSSVGQQIMGFNDKGMSVCDLVSIRKPSWEDIVKLSTKIVTFFDLAGHERYLRTTIDGMISNKPDYVAIVVGSNMSITAMTIEHINLCLTLHIPFFVIMTKIDLAPPDVYRKNFEDIDRLVKKTAETLTFKVKDHHDVLLCAKKMNTGVIVPIFSVSNVTGEGLDLLKVFLNYLPVRRSFKKSRGAPVKMQVQDIFNVSGTGTVVGGLLFSGTARVGSTVLLGPNTRGEFVSVRIRTMQVKRTSVTEASPGSYVCLGIPIDKTIPRRGMFVLGPELNPKAIWEFNATIYINSSVSTNVNPGYQPHCHIGHIRQTCKIVKFLNINVGKKTRKARLEQGIDPESKGSIGAGDTADVTMRFCYKPEVIFEEDKTKFIFRECRTRGVGLITEVTDTLHKPLPPRITPKTRTDSKKL